MSSGTEVNPSAVFTRRHDLDWLRIIAFGLLIFYHIGMFFNTEGWHAKSLNANDAMEPFMWLSSPWRLPLLFFVSGVAIRFLSDKLGSARFAADRSWRLFPVILFGMYVIVAPQTYVELRTAGEIEAGFAAFYQRYAGEWGGPWPVHTPTWNHLWYVVYLFVYSLFLAPLVPLLRVLADSRPLQAFGRILARNPLTSLGLLLLPLVPLMAIRFSLVPSFPTTHDLVGDWANHAQSLTMVLLGYFMAKNEGVWRAVDKLFPIVAAVTLSSLAFLLWCYLDWDNVATNETLLWIARIDRVVFTWSIILTLIGLARRFLNTDGPVRRYLTEAVFPYYILHQTITVAAGYWLNGLGLGVWTEFFILVMITFGGCALGYEIIKRIPILRPVMGLKWKRDAPKARVQAA
ncbi:acyltransferase [Maricaulis sp.]|uniref:acyltransferase family protein n=1 Tax=Maricaulis sp. TaxID=1486257 RepID=UPI00260CA2E0|nr:acyltransferase [Maricaulis sp.]